MAAGYFLLQVIDRTRKRGRRVARLNVLAYETYTVPTMRKVLLKAVGEHGGGFDDVTAYAYAHPDDIRKAAWLARITVSDGTPGNLESNSGVTGKRKFAEEFKA